MKSILIAFATLLVVLASCSSDDEKTPAQEVMSQQVVARFKSYFYQDGAVCAVKLDGYADTEWAVAIEDGKSACEIFTSITGMAAPLSTLYEYAYTSSDGECRIRLAGRAQPDAEALYATFYIQIPGCPEISKIHLGSADYFKGTNSGGEGYPVLSPKKF